MPKKQKQLSQSDMERLLVKGLLGGGTYRFLTAEEVKTVSH